MAKSAFRVLEILEFVAQCPSGAATHSEIATGLDIPKSSLTELLRDLTNPGYLEYDEATGRFSVGTQVMFLAHSYIKRLNIVRDGAPFVHRLFLEVNEFTTMAIPKGDQCIVVCAETLPSPLAHSLSIGEHLPMLPSALGKAILAFLDEAELDTFLATHKPVSYTAQTRMKLPDIRKEMQEIRQAGVAFSREEYLGGITGIAAPVFNLNGRPIA